MKRSNSKRINNGGSDGANRNGLDQDGAESEHPNIFAEAQNLAMLFKRATPSPALAKDGSGNVYGYFYNVASDEAVANTPQMHLLRMAVIISIPTPR